MMITTPTSIAVPSFAYSKVLKIHGFEVAKAIPAHYAQFAHGRSHIHNMYRYMRIMYNNNMIALAYIICVTYLIMKL